MRVWSLCLWLLLMMSPGLAYTQTEGDSNSNGTTESAEGAEGTDTSDGGGSTKSDESTDEEPDCD